MPDLDGYPRFAVYWMPEPEGPLARFGAAWLGWDPERGLEPAPAEVPGLPRPRAALTARARRYGFHATLVHPVRPATDPHLLAEALAALAARTAPVALPPLAPDAGLGFVALRPSRPVPEADALAEACLRAIHPLAMPPDGAELERRRAAGLGPAEEANLLRWGYPWVLDAFRFHLTLTGPLPPGEARTVLAALRPVLAPLLALPPAMRSLALLGDPGPGRGFRLIRRFPLAGPPAGPLAAEGRSG